MIFAGFSLSKLFSGFNILNGEKLGKLVFYLVIIAACLFLFWKLFVAPTHKTTQRAESITNITEQKEDGFSLIKIKILGWGN